MREWCPQCDSGSCEDCMRYMNDCEGKGVDEATVEKVVDRMTKDLKITETEPKTIYVEKSYGSEAQKLAERFGYRVRKFGDFPDVKGFILAKK